VQGHIVPLEVRGHGHVDVVGVELHVDLLVDERLQLGAVVLPDPALAPAAAAASRHLETANFVSSQNFCLLKLKTLNLTFKNIEIKNFAFVLLFYIFSLLSNKKPM
jgi:hypothetical protein